MDFGDSPDTKYLLATLSKALEFEKLLAFCKSEFSTENILFLNATRCVMNNSEFGIGSFRQHVAPDILEPFDKRDQIYRLHRRYVPSNAVAQVNLPADIQKAMEAAVKSRQLSAMTMALSRSYQCIFRMFRADTFVRYQRVSGWSGADELSALQGRGRS